MVTFAGLESDLALAHPELLEPWDGTIERVRAGLHEFRRQKASARRTRRAHAASGMRNSSRA